MTRALSGHDGLIGRIYDAACDSPWDATDQGLWCPHCGDVIAPEWFFRREDYEPPESCRQCGYPEFGA